MTTPEPAKHVVIEYCVKCRWLLRAAWMAQELLSTFAGDLEAVTLQPAGSGVFRISIDGTPLWDRQRDGGFPEAKVVKQLVRDQVCPDKDLGHADRTS